VKLSELMLSASLRLYTLLLLIYPRSFRREYGEFMIQLFRDRMRDGIRQRGCLGAIKVWWRVVAEARYSMAAALACVGKEKEKAKKINGKLR